ncbi:MAG: primosomal protein N' (replication factor Y) [Halieaceae bacterium]|jgi:primosomal protein N' (replication factor Y)
MLSLCRWAADYYSHPLGEVLMAALPRALREGRPPPRDAWRLSTRGLGLADNALARAPAQSRVIRRLQESRSCNHQTLREEGISAAILRELQRKALIERCLNEPTPVDASLRETGPPPGEEQAAAITAIGGQQGFGCHLLEGVTGSGKTEVYLQLIAACLARGEQSLVLVPEIGLTPQTLARFAARFATPIAVLHSGLSDGQRLRHWLAASSGSAGIVLGTRSAILTPMASLGLIVVDEEHDSSYKQQDGFRYSARDVAVKRAQLENCRVVLGSATPSLESLYNVQRGRYGHHQLHHRQGGGALPTLETIDLRGVPLQGGISELLLAAVRQTVEVEKQQALLFLNRRGYAPTLQCHSCGWVAGCRNCDARMTVHLRQRCLRCHHCAARQPLAPRCPDCGSDALMARGLGTEQTEEFLRSTLKCPVYRVDSDAMRGPEAMQMLLSIAHSDEPCVLLGTQMLTKGHHFPAVQLVGVIDTDALLYSADFRGPERMAQLLIQVAGRAGRERQGGRVLLQTHYPSDPLVMGLRGGSYREMALRLLESRCAAGLPPAGQLFLLRSDAVQETAGEKFLQAVRATAVQQLPSGCQIIGPLPSAMPRRAGRYRWQLWCLAPSRTLSQEATRLLTHIAEGMARSKELSWFIDVDPVDVV